MVAHFFNPWHEMALACNKTNFTPPSAAYKLQYDIGFLPALWAHDNDVVLVPDVCVAKRGYEETVKMINNVMGMNNKPNKNIMFVNENQLPYLNIEKIAPWGWDKASVAYLSRWGVRKEILPSAAALDAIRNLSHRKHVAKLLNILKNEYTTGFSIECYEMSEIEEMMRLYTNVVIKAPWSCSGRGIRFIKGNMTSHQFGWIKNLLKAQGSVIVEPYYKKVLDFGLEFNCTDKGVMYNGLSLFETDNWAYTGNVLATEAIKREILSCLVSVEVLDDITRRISEYLTTIYKGNYCGNFGVDMMIVSEEDGSLKIHPCVEINLRNTMGHVALQLTPTDATISGILKIEYNHNYKLKINFYETNFDNGACCASTDFTSAV